MDLVLGALVGVVTVVIFLGSTPLVLKPMLDAAPQISPATALLFFAAKAVAATAAVLVLFDVGGVTRLVDPRAFGIAAAITSVVWTTWLLMRLRRDRTPIYDLPDDGA